MPTVTERGDIITLAAEVIEHLRGLRQRLAEEIRAYPTPIPRCDAQFNHVYEQRSRIAGTLHRVNGALDGTDPREDLVAALAEFATMAPIAESAEERELRERVRMALAGARSAPVPATRHDARHDAQR
jgi:hypothetical protein